MTELPVRFQGLPYHYNEHNHSQTGRWQVLQWKTAAWSSRWKS